MELPKKSVAATEIKNRFGDYLGEVVKTRTPLVIERHGNPVAIMVDMEKWKQMQEKKEEPVDTPWIAELKRVTEEIAKNHPEAKKFSASDLIRQIREEEF